MPQTLSAGGGIPRAAPLRAPDPIRRGRNTQNCTFVTRSGFVPDGPRATDAASLAVDGGTTRAVVRRGAVVGLARESVIVAGSGASNGRETGVRIAASGGDWCWTDATVVTAVIGRRCGLGTAGIASPERADSCCDGGGMFSWDARDCHFASRSFSRVSASFAVPAALLRCRCLRSADCRHFSVADLPRFRVCFAAGCVSVWADSVIVQ
jgi:hypothetical protein